MSPQDQTPEDQESETVKKDDPVAVAILAMTQGGVEISPQDIARNFSETKRKPKDRGDLWRKYLPSVKQQVIHLVKNGRLEILRKGEVVDWREFKGLVKVRQPK
jgi:hypothetical protein